MMKTHLFRSILRTTFLLLPLLPAIAPANYEPLWQDIAARNISSHESETQRRTLRLNMSQLQARIRSAAATQNPLTLTVPLPDGNNADIELQPVTTLSAELQQRYPDIKTWRINSTHPDILSGRAELTELGLRIMLRSATNSDQWLIEPLASNHYQSYSKRQAQADQSAPTFSCGVQAGTPAANWQRLGKSFTNTPFATPQQPWHSKNNTLKRIGNNLLSYDLAISATGEYTQEFGGSKTAAYAGIVSTVNRINEIYEQELGVTLKLVSGTETVFNNAATDPFDNDSLLLATAQNQEVLDALVGSNRYDVGHVMGAALSNNGVAYVSSVCNNSRKAQGITVSNSPLADSFIVDYVAHELGHQLGATHTFNSTHSGCGGGGRIASTAFEPGSGSTIMSYAGICANHNLQQHVDPQFHSGSIAQIHKVLLNGSGASCAQNVAVNNSAPSVNAGADYTIPARTPFILNGSANDSDSDQLQYSWDQLDTGDASAPGTDTANNALIKSNRLSSSGLRHIPDIAQLLSTTLPGTGESLPRSNRDLNFRLNVRDGKGASGSDDIKISVHDTSADFRVLSPTGSLNAGSHEIRWQVADTDQSPISCKTIDIAATNDSGASFTDLKLKTPNDGSETVQLNTPAKNIRIKCSNNIFFALSGITPHVAAYKSDTAQPSQSNTTNTATTTAADTNADTDDADTDDGGGGTVPLHLLLICGVFTLLIRLRSK